MIRPDRIHLNDTIETDHFENLQSTNWQTVRWKPPPKGRACGPHIGWRVEFRSMEVQLTDFENAGTKMGRVSDAAPHTRTCMHSLTDDSPLPLLPLQRSPCSWCWSRA